MIQVSDLKSANEIVSEFNLSTLNERQIHFRIDKESEVERDGSANVFIGNLAWQVTDDMLNEVFARFHPYSLRVIRNMSGRSRGFGIAKFDSVEDSNAAIECLNGVEIGGRKIEVRKLDIVVTS